MSERASGQGSGPIQTSRFQKVLNHSTSVETSHSITKEMKIPSFGFGLLPDFKLESGHFPASIGAPKLLVSIRFEDTCCRPKLSVSPPKDNASAPASTPPTLNPEKAGFPVPTEEAPPPDFTRAPLPTTPNPSPGLEGAAEGTKEGGAADEEAVLEESPPLWWLLVLSLRGMLLLRLETCCCLALSKFWLLLGRLLWLAGEIPVSVKEAPEGAEDGATDEETAPPTTAPLLSEEEMAAALEWMW